MCWGEWVGGHGYQTCCSSAQTNLPGCCCNRCWNRHLSNDPSAASLLPSHQTFDGIDVCGERLAGEIRAVAAAHPSLRRISLLSHSMGGLIRCCWEVLLGRWCGLVWVLVLQMSALQMLARTVAAAVVGPPAAHAAAALARHIAGQPAPTLKMPAMCCAGCKRAQCLPSCAYLLNWAAHPTHPHRLQPLCGWAAVRPQRRHHRRPGPLPLCGHCNTPPWL